MDYKKGLYRLLDNYGRPTTLYIKGITYSDNAIVQLMRYKNKMYIDLPVNELGTHDNGSYLYIGKPDYDFSKHWQGTRVMTDGLVFMVKRAQMIYCGTQPLYLWAILYPAVKDGDYERT